ncbi:MAG: hypothetical protein H3C31_01120 [Brumimicrobium sp.]|nr:hypothetical protein [Brumimicrobium sp.]MCO5269329.1 hypothetical protein [Brumimicrobium sp.]
MRKVLLLMMASALILGTGNSFAQNNKKELNCFEKYEQAFKERGAYTISDNIYRNVMISFFEGNEVYCIRGKVRVEGGYITSIFYYYDDNTEELYDKKFYATATGEPPAIKNGISDLITNADREKLRIVFIDQLRPKKKQLQKMSVPDDL